jgi:hypothetical protein
MNAYRRLPRWAQWTIPVVVVIVIASAASSSSSKKGSATAKSSTAQASTRSANKKSGWAGAEARGAREGPIRAKYIAQADATCTRLQKQYGKRETELTTRLDTLNIESLEGKEEATRTIEALALISHIRTGQFQALVPPPADKAEISKIVTNRNEETAHLKLAVEAVATGDSKTAREALELVKSDNEEYAGMVQRYGFKTCG